MTLWHLPAGAPSRDTLIGFGDPYFNAQEAAEAEAEQNATHGLDIGNLTRLSRCGVVPLIIPANMRRAAMRFLQSHVQRHR